VDSGCGPAPEHAVALHPHDDLPVLVQHLMPDLDQPDARLAFERPFLQVIYDIEVPRMAFGRVCLLGDAAFVVRPHAAAGTAKAAADAWALAETIARETDVPKALSRWESEQLALGAQLLERTRRIGRRSQVDGNWVPGDPELIFGLRGPGR